MFSYLPEYESIPHSPRHFHHSVFVSYDTMPRAPGIRTQPLPLATPAGTTSPAHLEGGLFPLNILDGIPTAQTTALRSITLTTPVHLHAPDAHIAVVHSNSPGQRTSGLEMVYFLQSLVWQPVNLQTTFDRLSRAMRAQVEMAFMRRVGHSLNAGVEYWDQSTPGQRAYSSVVGYDVLLGNDEIWGFERVSLEGCSVIHLDRNSSR